MLKHLNVELNPKFARRFARATINKQWYGTETIYGNKNRKPRGRRPKKIRAKVA